jgi:hypothetical protein
MENFCRRDVIESQWIMFGVAGLSATSGRDMADGVYQAIKP